MCHGDCGPGYTPKDLSFRCWAVPIHKVKCHLHQPHHPYTVRAGAANCVLGTFLMRDLLGMPWLLWLLPVACSLGGLMLAGMSLEIPRMHRVREVSVLEIKRVSLLVFRF